MSDELLYIQAIKRMKELTKAGVPFEICYFTLDGRKKVVKKALLRPGFSRKQSTKSKFLVAYTNLITNEHRQFYRALLISVNQKKVKR